MIARAFPYDRPCRFQKFEATETILATGTTIWKPGFSYNEMAILFAFPRLNFQTLFKVSNQFSPNLVRCLVSSLSVFTELEGNNPN